MLQDWEKAKEKEQEQTPTAAGAVAKTEPGSGQSSCCFWSAAQWAWSNTVWENDWHHADGTSLTSFRFCTVQSICSHPVCSLLLKSICVVQPTTNTEALAGCTVEVAISTFWHVAQAPT